MAGDVTSVVPFMLPKKGFVKASDLLWRWYWKNLNVIAVNRKFEDVIILGVSCFCAIIISFKNLPKAHKDQLHLHVAYAVIVGISLAVWIRRPKWSKKQFWDDSQLWTVKFWAAITFDNDDSLLSEPEAIAKTFFQQYRGRLWGDVSSYLFS